MHKTLVLPFLFLLSLCNAQDSSVPIIDAHYFKGQKVIQSIIQEEMIYPYEAFKHNTEGTIELILTIAPNYEIQDIKPISPKEDKLDYGLEEEAIRIMEYLGSWVQKGYENKGAFLKVKIPINFELQKAQIYYPQSEVDSLPRFKYNKEITINEWLQECSSFVTKGESIDFEHPLLVDLYFNKQGEVAHALFNIKNKGDKNLAPRLFEIIRQLLTCFPAIKNDTAVACIYTISLQFKEHVKDSREAVQMKETRPNNKSEKEISKTLITADISPTFPGGLDSMKRFIKKVLVYPMEAFENEIEGVVWISATISSTGKVSDVKPTFPLSKQLGFGMEQAAMDAIKKMPYWIPGKYLEENISMKMNIPVSFQMD